MEKYNSPMWLQRTVNSFLKQSAKAENHNDDDEEEEETISYFQASRNLSPLRKAAKRTTGACRLPSPSGPLSFTRRAVGPWPLL